ncbi:hypothetical protein AB9F41_36135, partial [Rhizobium leguminosarum]|uniref:hypothetical protein n=1 Tax=Rhizobium leguminosarum TaxID=384 RepID=UPI003F97CF78
LAPLRRKTGKQDLARHLQLGEPQRYRKTTRRDLAHRIEVYEHFRQIKVTGFGAFEAALFAGEDFLGVVNIRVSPEENFSEEGR